jgi:dipeptidyl aminopeptidase/acylaminoacyl peptidase
MAFEDMMQMKRLGDTAVSPDGKWLAYSVSTVSLEQNKSSPELWLERIEGGEPQKISVSIPGDSGVQFAADFKSILFISKRTGAAQIWRADFDTATGATTHERKVTNLDLGIDNARWTPDGRSIIFTAPVYPDCAAIAPNDNGAGAKCNYDRDAKTADSKVKALIFTELLYRHWNRYTGEKRSHLFIVSLDSGAIRDLTPNEPHDVPPFSLSGGGGFAVSPDSKEVAFTMNPDSVQAISTSAQIYILDLTEPSAKPVKVSASAGGNFNPAYSPDGKYIAWRSQARAGYEADRFRLAVLDRAAKKLVGPAELIPFDDRWVDEFAWSPDSKFIYFVKQDEGTARICRTNLDGLTVILTQNGEYSGLLPTASGEAVVASRMTVRQPNEVVALRPNRVVGETGGDFAKHAAYEENQLTHLNDALLAQLDLPKIESFWFRSKDGTRVQAFLIRPPGFDSTKKYPLKFLIHGGPQGAWGDSWSYRWNAELFAADGYVVVMINPRGSTGYGQAFVDGVNGDWGGKPYTDLMTGLDYAEQHYPFIDRTRECALGASYGGYMANWILGHTDRFKCIVSHDGMFNAESAFGSTEEDWFNIWEFKGAPWDYYGKPDMENPFRKWSPSYYAKHFRTPTLVVHGQLDYRLDVSEGLQLFDTLQLLKVPSKMLYFPDEGHWVLKPQNSQLWYKTVNDWVDQWTKKRAE